MVLCIALVLSCAHKANSRTEKNKAKDTVGEEQFSIMTAVRIIGEQHCGIDKPNYPKNSKQGSKDSFNVHNYVTCNGLFQLRVNRQVEILCNPRHYITPERSYINHSSSPNEASLHCGTKLFQNENVRLVVLMEFVFGDSFFLDEMRNDCIRIF